VEVERNSTLKIDVEHREDHQARLTVEIEATSLDEAKQRAARRISKQTKIPGFRPGKAPYSVVHRLAGEEAIMDEAIELLVHDLYPKILDESGIKPYGPGSLENVQRTNPPVFEFVVPLKAEVELGDFHAIRIPYQEADVSDDEVENVLQSVRQQHSVIEPVDRPAQEGDLVYIQLSAERLNPQEGQDPVLINERTLPINISPESDDAGMEWPFPGFSRNLLGLSANAESQIEYSYPDEAAFSTFNGAKGLFKVKVDSVKTRTLPELDNAFAQTVGDFTSLDDLRERLSNNLKEQAVDDYNREYDEQLLDKILEISTVKYPPQMLEHEIDHVVDNLKQQLARQGTDIDLYIKSRGTTLEQIREEALPVAESRLKHSLILIEAADYLKVEVSPEELQSETERTLTGYSRVMPEKEFRKLFSTKESTSGLVSNVMMDLLIEQTQERLRAIARGEEPAVDETSVPEEIVEILEETASEIDTTQASSDTNP